MKTTTQTTTRIAAASVATALLAIAGTRGGGAARAQDAKKDEPVLITWKFREGEERAFRMVQDLRVKTTPVGGGAATSMHQRLETTGRFFIPEARDGHALMRIETRTVKVERTNEGKTFELDSESESAPKHAATPSLQGILSFLREIPELRFDTKKGALVDMAFVPSEAGLLRFPLPQGAEKPGSGSDADKARRKQFLDTQKPDFDGYFNRRVKHGDEWVSKSHRNIDGGVRADAEQKSRFEDMSPFRGLACARMSLSYTYAIPPGNAKLIEASGTGEVFWDVEGGYMASSVIDRRWVLQRPKADGKGYETREIIGRDEFRVRTGTEIPR